MGFGDVGGPLYIQSGAGSALVNAANIIVTSGASLVNGKRLDDDLRTS